jgi:uncharacterized coiled-coil DUF342 family protein
MNREEKHQLVCQLYGEGKTMREIAKEVHMSFGDIGSVIKRLNQELHPKSKEKSKVSQALELFKKGNDPVKVALSLDLSPTKTESIYKQFLKLSRFYKLLDLYKKVGDDVSLLSTVHDVMKKYDLSKKDIINIVHYAEKRIFLKEEIHELEHQFDYLLKQRHVANDSLLSTKKKYTELLEQIDKYNDISAAKSSHIENLNSEIKQLENYISRLKDSDGYYTKFEQFAREKLDLSMKDRKWILSLAVASVIESIRKDPDIQMIIKDEIAEIDQDKLLDLCEVMFDKLLKQLMDLTLRLDAKQDSGPNSSPNSDPSIA